MNDLQCLTDPSRRRFFFDVLETLPEEISGNETIVMDEVKKKIIKKKKLIIPKNRKRNN